MRALGLALLLAAACGKTDSKKEEAKAEDRSDCTAACEHTMALALADIEKNMAALGDPDATAKILAETEKTRASDLATCVSHCKAGKLDPTCALAARTIDGAMTCAGSGPGTRTPVEPPAERRDEDWPKATLREVSGAVGGAAFTLKIPTELQEQEADRSDTSRGWDFPNQPFSQPRFRVAVVDAFPENAEAGLAYYGIDEDKKVVRQEHTGDRFVLLYEADTYVVAQVIARAGARGVDCYGTHSGHNLTRKDLIGPWLLEVCSTLTVE